MISTPPATAGVRAILPSQLRVGQAEHVAERRVVGGVAGRSLQVEPEAVAVEGHRLVEIGHDRTEVVARTDDEAGGAPGRFAAAPAAVCASAAAAEPSTIETSMIAADANPGPVVLRIDAFSSGETAYQTQRSG
jgi:hypothetical protein